MKWWRLISEHGNLAGMSTPSVDLTFDGFTQATINVLREDGIAEYLPTIVVPGLQECNVVEGIPTHVDHREALQNIVQRRGYETQEFFFAVRTAVDELTLGHHRPHQPAVFLRITEFGEEYPTRHLEQCAWWKLS